MSESMVRPVFQPRLVSVLCLLVAYLFALESLSAQQNERPLDFIPGWTAESYQEFQEETTWPSKHPMMLNVLSRLSNISHRSMDLYLAQTKLVELDSDDFSATDWLGYFFQLKGHAKKVQQVKLDEELGFKIGFERYLVVQMVDEQGKTHRIICRHVPEIWKSAGEGLNEKITCSGLLSKQLPGSAGLVFLADHLNWFPDQPNKKFNIGPDQQWLAENGIDFGLLDLVKNQSQTAFNRQEAVLLLQMLVAVLKDNQSSSLDNRSPDLIGWLKNPDECFGNSYQIPGRVKRVTRVVVEDESLRKQYGIEEYFQLDVYISIPDLDIEIVQPDGSKVLDKDQQPFGYRGQYAVLVVCPELPDGFDLEGQLSKQTKFNVLVDGFFMKNWRHRNFRTREISNDLLKTTPIIIGFQPEIVEVEAAQTWPYLVGVIIVAGSILLFLFIAWRFSSQENELRKQRTKTELPDHINVDF